MILKIKRIKKSILTELSCEANLQIGYNDLMGVLIVICCYNEYSFTIKNMKQVIILHSLIIY